MLSKLSRYKFTTAFLLSCGIGFTYISSVSSSCMRESPITASQHGIQPRKHFLTQEIVSKLKTDGIVVIDNVLSKSELLSARAEVNKIYEHSKNFVDNGHDDVITRRDFVFWISEIIGLEQFSFINKDLLYALRCVRSIPNELTTYGYNSIEFGVPLSNQLSCFDGSKAHYIPHRDKPESTYHPLKKLLFASLYDRQITIILYLNDKDWDSKVSGGSLKCYINANEDDITGETATEIIEIEPKGGRMVIFDSSTILHEVTPTFERRLALTAWIGGRHSVHSWLRVLCIPLEEINWKFLRNKMFGSA